VAQARVKRGFHFLRGYARRRRIQDHTKITKKAKNTKDLFVRLLSFVIFV
jgi:hypothetical protein